MNSGICTGMEMVERALALLRSRSAAVWAVQAAGAIPLLLIVLYFASDTISNPSDQSRAATESLLCAVCFIWFNICRARFAQLLTSALSGRPPEPWRQALDPRVLALQSCRLFLMPIACIGVIPISWAVSFFRGNTVFAGRAAFKRAAKMAGVWPRQTWLALGSLALLAIAVFVNILLVLAALPSIARIFSGIENDYTRLNLTLNSTVFITAFGLTWLLLDPLYQAVFCVRAFLAESRETGLDLMFALRHLAVVAALVLFIGTVMSPHAVAQQEPRITTSRLDAGIDKVLAQHEYDWRLPRAGDDSKPFLENIFGPIKRFFHAIGRWISRLFDILFRNDGAESSGKKSPFPAVRWTFVALLAALAIVVAWVIVRLTRPRKTKADAVPTQAARAIQLNDDRVSAADLPEEQWTALGQECLARGEYRLALRAFYLANLSWLGRRGLLTIAPSRSNRDYWRELRRRSPNELVNNAFSENMRAFERVWYGTHAVDAGQVAEFERTFLRMKGYAEP
jgi:Domain of unknown function (DUF4129)